MSQADKFSEAEVRHVPVILPQGYLWGLWFRKSIGFPIALPHCCRYQFMTYVCNKLQSYRYAVTVD